MRIKEKNNVLLLYPEGRIDSANAAGFEREVRELLGERKAGKGREIFLDLSGLTFISSMGLRVVLKLYKEGRISGLKEVKPEVYEILDMTGLGDIIPTERALRQISIEGCEMIGLGGNGTVYRLPGDEIVKVYVNHTAPEDIRREREYARQAFLLGLPTAIPYDVVRCGEYYGIVFERIRADTLSRILMDHPEEEEDLIRKFGVLVRQFHETELRSGEVPRMSEQYHGVIDRAAGLYTREEIAAMHRFVDGIPERDTLCHGDLNTKNVMLQDGEFLLIDMAELSVGNPIYDLFCTCFVHKLNITFEQGAVARFLEISEDLSERVWKGLLEEYFKELKSSPADMARIDEAITRAAYFRITILPVLFLSIQKEGRAEHFVETARREFFPYVDECLEELRWLDEVIRRRTET